RTQSSAIKLGRCLRQLIDPKGAERGLQLFGGARLYQSALTLDPALAVLDVLVHHLQRLEHPSMLPGGAFTLPHFPGGGEPSSSTSPVTSTSNEDHRADC